MLSLLRRQDSTSLSLLALCRHMGGGPRTFPGGLNKWQWKRLHEKKAKEKEKRLLDHEKQLYQARIRSSIRASFRPQPVGEQTHLPRSAEDHVKGLADRFMKEGAEDLWNERDGPVISRPSRRVCGPIDVRKLVSRENGDGFSSGNLNNGIDERDMNSNDGIKSRPSRWIRGPIDVRKSGSGENGSSGSDEVLSNGCKSRDSSAFSMNLNGGIRDRYNTAFSMNLNDGINSRHYSVSSMNSNDGFNSKSRAFFTKNVSTSVNSSIGFKARRVSGYSINSNDGLNSKSHAFITESANTPVNDGFKLKNNAFLGKSWNSVNLIDPRTSFHNRYASLINLKDGFKSRHYCVYVSIGNLDDGIETRHYSAYSKDLNGGIKPRNYSAQAKGRTRSRFDFSDDSSDEESASEGEEEEKEKKGSERRFTSSAALGKYDKKKTRRVPLKFVDVEDDLSKQVDAIRNEVKQRRMVQNTVDKSNEDSILSQKRFDECNVSPLTVKALTQAGYVQMTRVQDATLSVCLEGKDALVKAKTGTGKSAAFLLPAIETVLKVLSSKKKERAPPVYVLILCPMRELASQIAAEANVMLKYHEGIGVQTLVGGTRFKVDQKQLESNPCQIIVATPGRLLDHIESKSGISVRLLGLKMLILDEADHLLDLGFRKDIEKIVDCLPRERQSLLFSATVPKEVRRISQLVLKREHAYIDTVGLGCVETPYTVKQFKMVAPHDQHFQMVHHLLSEHISQTPDYKVIVFCTTAMVTSLMFLLLREFKMNVREIHSRKPQLYRTRVSEEFKESKRQILISSDVSARGMNYPGVTLVIQVGIPSDREHYIHRLGRAGREGKEGEGILLLAPWEEYFLDDIKDLPIANYPVPRLDPDFKTKVEQSMSKIDSSVREAAYHAWLGYYNSIGEIGRDKTTLAELANQFSQFIGLEKPPSLFRKTALKMGLRDIPGIRIRK